MDQDKPRRAREMLQKLRDRWAGRRAADSSPPVLSGHGGASADPFVGHTVAERYQVLRRIGQGGMGSVYQAGTPGCVGQWL